MNSAILEHVNVTVSDPEKTATLLSDLFNWHIRWSGDSINGGKTIHVGSEGSYVALYSPGGETTVPAAVTRTLVG